MKIVAFFVLCLVLPLSTPAYGVVPCNSEFGVDLTAGTTSADGTVYTEENIVRDGDQVIGCVCKVKKCARKCCPHGQYLLNQSTCDTVSVSTTFDFPHVDTYHIIHGHLCPSGSHRSLLFSDEFSLRPEDGVLVLSSTGEEFDQAHYCVDNILEEGEIKGLVCSSPEQEAVAHANVVGMIISMPFLLVTFLVYVLLPDRNLHGKSLMCYVFTLFWAYVLLVVIQLHSQELGSQENSVCVMIGIMCLFFFMVSFFWINVMSIDIWWTFSGLRGFSGSKKQKERKRFILYSGYAWGTPLLLVVILTSLTYSTNITSDDWYKPGFGEGQCWLSEGIPTLVFFYGPLSILITANIILFGTTAWKIRQVQKDTAMLRRGENKKHEKDKQQFNLFLKLLLAMGVNWSMEIISWAVSWRFGTVPEAVWYLTDFCNALYGVFIFFVFVFKINIWLSLKKRYYLIMGKPHLARTVTTGGANSSPRTTMSSVASKSPHVKYSTCNSVVDIEQVT